MVCLRMPLLLCVCLLVAGPLGADDPAPKPLGPPKPSASDLEVTPAERSPAPAAKPKEESAPNPAEVLRSAPKLTNLETRKAGVDWPAFLGPTGDSKSPEKGILTKWPEAGPRLLWRKRLGISYDIGTVSRGRYFLFDRDRIADNARVLCFEAETGNELWQFVYPSDYEDTFGYNGGPRCSPVVDDDRVYVFGAEGMLHCLRTMDGALVWNVNTAQKFGVIQNFFGVGSTPVVEGNLLLVMVGGSPPSDQNLTNAALDRVSGNGCGIVAFDKFTGAVKYKITDELASYSSPTLATINGRRWCFMFCRGGLVGFDPAAGKVDFEFPWRAKLPESVNAANPVVVGNEVFITETYGPGSALLSVKPGGASVVWKDDERKRDKAMQCHWNTPISLDGYLYGSSGRHTENAVLKCIEWKTGKEMWSEPRMSRTSLMYVDGHFVCLGEYGQLTLFKANPAKFEPVAEVVLRDPVLAARPDGIPAPPLLKYPCWAAPILSHGLLYVRGDTWLVCLDLIPDAGR